MTAPITGRKVFAITAGAFGIIIAVNVAMAVLAVRTFPGLEVRNSYVASQDFDHARAAQESLGWRLEHDYSGDRLRLTLRDRDGYPLRAADLTATIGRATMAAADVAPAFDFDGDAYVATVALAPGKWVVMLTAHAEDGTAFRQRFDIFVRG